MFYVKNIDINNNMCYFIIRNALTLVGSFPIENIAEKVVQHGKAWGCVSYKIERANVSRETFEIQSEYCEDDRNARRHSDM